MANPGRAGLDARPGILTASVESGVIVRTDNFQDLGGRSAGAHLSVQGT
jgi:hypothetical protein